MSQWKTTTKKSHDDEQSENAKRRECIRLKGLGWSVTRIAQFLGRSRKWAHTWIRRYDPNNSNWYRSASKRPLSSPRKVDADMEAAVITIRQELVRSDQPDLEYSFTGAIAIHQQLAQRGFQDLPSLSTINRILKKHDLVVHKQRSDGTKSGKYYPALPALYPNHRHELDLVAPRYISGYGRVVSVNRIDVATNHANLQVYGSKTADAVIVFLIDDWKIFGIPRFLQLDNESSFRGGLYHPRSFGRLVRFCLNFGVEIIFIPWKEPWRNPYIENFNGHFNRVLWQRKRFQDLAHLRREGQRFLLKHNDYQTYKKKLFLETDPKLHPTIRLPETFQFDPGRLLPITKGKVHFVRMVEEEGTISVLNETLTVGRDLSFEYVWATIDTAQQRLFVYHRSAEDQPRQLVKEHEYKLKEPVCEPIPIKDFCSV